MSPPGGRRGGPDVEKAVGWRGAPGAEESAAEAPGSEPPAAARASARTAAYLLFAELFRDGVSPSLLPTLRELPVLGETLPDPFDPDEAAAEHHRLFGLQVPPLAGVFLDPRGRVGGAQAAVVHDLHARAGLPLEVRGEEADHVSRTLALLASLAPAPALAAETLDRALLPWLPWLVEAVERNGDAFHRALAGLTQELATDHRASLDVPAPASPPSGATIEELDASAGLRELAAFLVTPARSGLYLSRDDVRRLVAGKRLPTGFGGRADTMETLLRGAGEFGGLAGVVDGLFGLVEAGRARCAAFAATGVPGAGAIAELREARLARTEELLERLRGVAGEGASG